jgi:hypothetical protein
VNVCGCLARENLSFVFPHLRTKTVKPRSQDKLRLASADTNSLIKIMKEREKREQVNIISYLTFVVLSMLDETTT